MTDNNRPNAEDIAIGMRCMVPQCPVQYKTRLSFDHKPNYLLKIKVQLAHSHGKEEFENVQFYGIKGYVQGLIDLMVANGSKPPEILNILEDYFNLLSTKKHSPEKKRKKMKKIWYQTRQKINRVDRMAPRCRHYVNSSSNLTT